MARIRTVKPSFFTSSDVCQCQPLARLLFIGLWCEADRRGRLMDKPLQIQMRVLPGDECDVDELLWELSDAGLVRRYETEEGAAAIQVIGFEKHQRPHPKEPESIISVTGREKTRPAVKRLDARRDEHLPSPVGMDKEYGVSDKESGVVEVEVPKAAAPAAPASRPERLRSDGPLAGTFQKDHLTHAFCGSRFCVTQKHFAGLARTYGDGGDLALTNWLNWFDAQMPSDTAFGGPVWLSQHWDAHLVQSGRVTPAPAAKPETAWERMKREAREKAAS